MSYARLPGFLNLPLIKYPAVREYVVVFIGSAIGSIFSLLISALLARTLSVADFGDFSLAFALMLLFAQLPKGVDPAFLRLHVASNDQQSQQVYLRALILIKLSFCLLLLAVALLASGTIATGLLHRANFSSFIFLAILGSSLLSFYDTMSTHFQACGKVIPYAVSRVLVFLFALVGIVVFMMMSDVALTVFRVLIIHVLVFAFLGAYALGYLARRAGRTVAGSSNVLGEFLNLSKWLILVGVMNVVYQRADLLILSRYASSSEVGIYAAASRINSLSGLLISALYVVYYPRALKTTADRSSVTGYLRESLSVVGPLLVALGMGSASAGTLLGMVFGAEYRIAGFALSLLLLSSGFMIGYTLLSFLLYAWDRTNSVFYLGTLKMFTLLGGGILLVPRFGANGAAWANVVANFGGFVLAIVAVLGAVRYRGVRVRQGALAGNVLPVGRSD